jgi:hypothetical protein
MPLATDALRRKQREAADLLDSIEQRSNIVGVSGDLEQLSFSVIDKIGYRLENWVAANPSAFYYVLFWTTLIVCVILGIVWSICPENRDNWDFSHSIFFTFQMLSIGGYDPNVTGTGPVIIFGAMIVFGLTIFAILIGMITESFQLYMHSLSEGKTKAVLSNHTLILGWNETTTRVVVEIARLRHVWREQNRQGLGKYVGCLPRHPASTPIAEAPVVIITDQLTKSEVQNAIRQAFKDGGICEKDNRIGCDIVCRIGDPTNLQDLKRVGAQAARSILVMMTDLDAKESEQAGGRVSNGASLRTLLALRAVLCCHPKAEKDNDMRVICQLAAPSKAIEVIDLGDAFDGRPILRPVELQRFMNGILFGCLAQPGLGYALLDLLGFEGAAFRSRVASEFPESHRLIGKTMYEMSTVWENAIFAGTAREGLAPRGDSVIQKNDRIVFVSASSLPRYSEHVPPTMESVGLVGASPKHDAQAILVCGWRAEWDEPEDFADQVLDVARTLPMGSQLVFLNLKGAQAGEASFEKFMETVIRTRRAAGAISPLSGPQKLWAVSLGVTLKHLAGDAADYETMDEVLQSHKFDQTIVISSVAGRILTPQLRDTRLMSILVQLRHLQLKNEQPAMHVIGENALDSTGVLAIGPTVGKANAHITKVPDFVNTHMIYASALTQALAYPRMFESICPLFENEPGTACLKMREAVDLIQAGRYKFLDLGYALRSRHEDEILVGVRKATGGMIMAPCLSKLIDIEPGDMLMVIAEVPEAQVTTLPPLLASIPTSLPDREIPL